MIGFEITKNELHSIKISSYSTQIFLYNYNDGMKLIPSGINEREDRLKWEHIEFHIGDKLSIEIKDIKEISSPCYIDKSDIEDLKKKYYELKTKLKKKGLILE